jgi:hypothetical protein
MYAHIFLTVCAFIPHLPVAADEVDLVEVNHFYNAEGSHVFDQVIFWQWFDDVSEFRVIAWRFHKSPHQTPYRDWRRGGYESVWHDGHVLRQVRAAFLRETWTQYDPEVHDRQFLPQEQRRGLICDPATSLGPSTR